MDWCLAWPDTEMPASFRTFYYPDGWFAEGWMGLPNQLIKDPEGKFWLATFHGLVFFDPMSGSFQRIVNPMDDPSNLQITGIRDIFMDAGKVIWISTGGFGLVKYDSQSHQYRHYLGHGPNRNTYSI